MALRFMAAKPDPTLLSLPWVIPLEQWGDEVVVPLPRGLSRHVVRIIRAGDKVYAAKETRERMASKEFGLLRNLRRLGLPTVEPAGIVHGRVDAAGQELEPVLLTEHLRYSLPYRSLFTHGLPAETLPRLVDALVVLLVRLHLAGFAWGDVSLSNVLFRRSAGEFAAYLVDAETGELHQTLSEGQRNGDLDVAYTNLFGELLDLQAGGLLDESIDAAEIVDLVGSRYDALWHELTAEEEFGTDETWRIQQRVERLNELGFDVEELEVVTDVGGAWVSIRPGVVEAGHHSRELQSLTGLDVEENQARRLLNDLASFTAFYELGGEDRSLVAHRWLTEVFEPVTRMVPPDLRGKLEPAETFHEVLLHRWFMSERAGKSVDTFTATRDYIDTVLRQRPDEALIGDAEPAAGPHG